MSQIKPAVCRGPVAQLVMAGQDDAASARAVAGQVPFQLFDAVLVECGEGFVQNPERWCLGQV